MYKFLIEIYRNSKINILTLSGVNYTVVAIMKSYQNLAKNYLKINKYNFRTDFTKIIKSNSILKSKIMVKSFITFKL